MTSLIVIIVLAGAAGLVGAAERRATRQAWQRIADARRELHEQARELDERATEILELELELRATRTDAAAER
jgi:hypothetical protein